MLEDILKSKVSLFADGVQTVIRGQENRNRSVAFRDGNLVQNARAEKKGVNALVTKNGVKGFASYADYSGDAVESVLKAATENALFLDKHAPKGLKAPAPLKSGMILPKRLIVDFKQKRMIELCKTFDDYVVKNCPKLISRTVVYTEDSMEKIIYTSDASNGHVTYPRCYVYVMMTAQTKEGTPVEHFKALGGVGSFEDQFADPTKYFADIDNLYKQIMDKAEGVYADAGLKTVVLDGELAGMLSHEAVGHTVEADLVNGGSVAGPLLGKQVASELVTLTDYAHTAFDGEAKLPVFLDDEGIEAEDAVLIKDGILVGYMHDRESAEKYGVKPCGNARGHEFSDEPIIRMRNTAIKPGKDKFEDMIASIDDGYYLICSGNGQADLTGEFMFGITMGYEIKNGKLGRALLDTTVSGVAFEMLKTVDMVSDCAKWSSSGYCGKKQAMPVSMGGPDLRCKIMIGGR